MTYTSSLTHGAKYKYWHSQLLCQWLYTSLLIHMEQNTNTTLFIFAIAMLISHTNWIKHMSLTPLWTILLLLIYKLVSIEKYEYKWFMLIPEKQSDQTKFINLLNCIIWAERKEVQHEPADIPHQSWSCSNKRIQ